MTALTAKATDRILFGALYIAVGVITLWAGFRLANVGLEMGFVNDYLQRWEVAIRFYAAHQGQWPVFEGNNHVDYMETLTRRMRRSNAHPPDSNTPVAYRYRIERFGGETEDIFILCLNDRIILFGISEKTLNRLDKMLDRQPDLGGGRLVGRPGKNQTTYIGQWRL